MKDDSIYLEHIENNLKRIILYSNLQRKTSRSALERHGRNA